MPDEIKMEDIEAARQALDSKEVMAYAHIPMTEEEAARAKVIIADDAQRAAREKAIEERLKQPIDPYPIPLGAMLKSMYTRRGIDNRHKCQGKHVQARVAKAQAKRKKTGKKPYTP